MQSPNVLVPISGAAGSEDSPRLALGQRDGRAALLTIDDLFWCFYLYPLRILAAFGPRRLFFSFRGLFEFRARKRRDIVVGRMIGGKCDGIARERLPHIATSFLANSGIRMLDDLILSWPSFGRNIRCSEIQGIERLERASAGGRGVLLLTAHFCANRIAKRHLAAIGYPILTVRDEISEGDWWGRYGRGILAPRRVKFLQGIMGDSAYIRDRGCTLSILSRLRSGGLVDIHFDGQAGKTFSPWPFLGAPRSFSTGILDIVRLSGCAVVPMLCLGNSSDFRIVFGPALDIVRTPGREDFVRANLPAFVETIEKQILDHPEEWEQWMSL